MLGEYHQTNPTVLFNFFWWFLVVHLFARPAPPQKKNTGTLDFTNSPGLFAGLVEPLSASIRPQNPRSGRKCICCTIMYNPSHRAGIGHAIKISGTRSAFLLKWPKSKRNFDANLSGPSKWSTNFCPVLPTLGLSFTSAVGVWNKAFLFCHSEHETKHSWMQLTTSLFLHSTYTHIPYIPSCRPCQKKLQLVQAALGFLFPGGRFHPQPTLLIFLDVFMV